MTTPGVDPIHARRARSARLVSAGKRIGYSALLLAIIFFFVALLTDFPAWQSRLIVALLAVACLVLPPAIVFGYGLRAAERQEAEEAKGRTTDS